MTAVTASEARTRFAELLSIVGFAKERVVIEKHHKPVAALVPIEEIVLLDELIAFAGKDDQFRERLAALEAKRDHGDVLALMANPSERIVLTPESFAHVVDRIRYPRPATQALKDLMAADGD
jgi:prevent-host-death family protein